MPKLKFALRQFLTLFRTFFGEDYLPSKSGNTDVHIMGQKMSYFLMLKRVYSDYYSFSWDSFGPYSEALQGDMIVLDFSESAVSEFYQVFDDESAFSNDSQDGSLFSIRDKQCIIDLASNLRIADHQEDKCRWIELLGSLTYLATSMMPGAKQESIATKLVALKPEHRYQPEEMQEAWDVLTSAGIVSNVA